MKSKVQEAVEIASKFPDIVTVQGVPYIVKWVEPEDTRVSVTMEPEEGEDVPVIQDVATNGYVDLDDEVINMDRTRPKYSLRVTLLHEIFHACFHQIGREDDEDTIKALSYVFLDMLRRNPSVVKFLTENLND